MARTRPQTAGLVLLGFLAVFFIDSYVTQFFFGEQLLKIIIRKDPLDALKLLFQNSEASGLLVFVVEPSLLRALRDGTQRRLELWGQGDNSVITVGVKDYAGLDQLHLVMSKMRRHGFDVLETHGWDPTGQSVDVTPRNITTHFLLWQPVEDSQLVIHFVLFYKLGDYLWHSQLTSSHPVTSKLNNSDFVKSAGIFKSSVLSDVLVDNDILVRYPQDTFSFIKEIVTSEFIDCDYSRARLYNAKYPVAKTLDNVTFKRKARQLLAVAKQVLDSLEIPFWLSSGTCLGWFRQCDIIPHTTDVDIGVQAVDYREDLVSRMESSGLRLVHLFGKESDSLELSFMYGGIKLDVFFFYKTPEYTWNGGTQTSTGNKYRYVFPPFSLCWTQFMDLWLRVPCPTLPYIHANYGMDWAMPIKDWDWKASPHNVVDNGLWPEEEWDQVMQVFEI